MINTLKILSIVRGDLDVDQIEITVRLKEGREKLPRSPFVIERAILNFMASHFVPWAEYWRPEGTDIIPPPPACFKDSEPSSEDEPKWNEILYNQSVAEASGTGMETNQTLPRIS